VENFLVVKMRQAVMDTVRAPADSLRAEYERNRTAYVFPKEVNLREIVVGSKQEADEILAQLRAGPKPLAGADFADLAGQHSLRMWSRQRGGEVGYVAKGELGQLGQAIFALPVGGLGGPYSIGRFYVIVQVLGFRDARQKTFAEAKAEIEESLIHYAQRAALKRQVEAWRQNYDIDMDTQGLSAVRSPLAKTRKGLGAG
jgi:parvulin-like peptidyl-prolyl isomerase